MSSRGEKADLEGVFYGKKEKLSTGFLCTGVLKISSGLAKNRGNCNPLKRNIGGLLADYWPYCLLFKDFRVNNFTVALRVEVFKDCFQNITAVFIKSARGRILRTGRCFRV